MIGTFALVFAGAGAVMVEAKTGALGHVGVTLTFELVIAAMICSSSFMLGLAEAAMTGRGSRRPTHRDEEGRVVGFGGLTLKPTSHVLEVDGRTLYAWCALDAVFLPERLGRPARIRSTSPQSGETISLTVDAASVHDVVPEGAAMTLHRVDESDDLKDVMATFCRYVHFFTSEQEARGWAERSEGTYVASIAEGFEYGRLYNAARLGAALAEDRAWR